MSQLSLFTCAQSQDNLHVQTENPWHCLLEHLGKSQPVEITNFLAEHSFATDTQLEFYVACGHWFPEARTSPSCMSATRCNAWVKGVQPGLSCWKLSMFLSLLLLHVPHNHRLPRDDVRLDSIMPLIVQVGINYCRHVPWISFNYSSNNNRCSATDRTQTRPHCKREST